MELPNMDIRNEAKEAGVKLWQIAERMGIQDATLSRKLRHLSENEKAEIRSIISELREVRKNA